MRFTFFQSTLFTVIPALGAWGLLGINAWYVKSDRSKFAYTWLPMLSTERFFIIIIPEKMSQSSYLAFKITLLTVQAFTMTFSVNKGIRASHAWWQVAASRADREDYERPTIEQVEAND